MANARFRAGIFPEHPAVLRPVDAVKRIPAVAQQLDVWCFGGTALLLTPFGDTAKERC